MVDVVDVVDVDVVDVDVVDVDVVDVVDKDNKSCHHGLHCSSN